MRQQEPRGGDYKLVVTGETHSPSEKLLAGASEENTLH